MTNDYRIWVWCIAKSVVVRKTPEPDGEIIDRIYFGHASQMLPKPVTNGRIKIEYCQRKEAHKRHVTGWVLAKAMTKQMVEDYSSLWFDNLTGHRLPVVDSYYNGKPVGFIEPGEQVAVSAKVGRFALTNRGWTEFGWLTKRREIFDQGVIDDVLIYVLAWAVRDYKSTVKKIKTRDYTGMKEFSRLVSNLEEIGVFFLDKSNTLNADKLPGRERFNSLNAELGIDEEWIKFQIMKADSWRDKVVKKRGSA